MANNNMIYFEDLDATGITCPHKDAFEPDGERIFYRVLKSNPATSDCFLPTPLRVEQPPPKDCDACVQKSVSVYDDLQSMINGFFKLPHNKGKKRHVAVLQLQAHDGRLKRTFGPGHHSWWRSQAFDITVVAVEEIHP